MRVAAHDRLRTWLPFAFPVSVLRAALVELVGEPLPAGAVSLGTPLFFFFFPPPPPPFFFFFVSVVAPQDEVAAVGSVVGVVVGVVGVGVRPAVAEAPDGGEVVGGGVGAGGAQAGVGDDDGALVARGRRAGSSR